MYGVSRKLLGGIKQFYKESYACAKADGEGDESFRIMGEWDRCVATEAMMELWKMTARIGNFGVELCMGDARWKLKILLFVDDIVLTAEN